MTVTPGTTSTVSIMSTDGVELAVYEQGVQGGPVLVCIHGYPDDHSVWDGVAQILLSRYRIVRYDVRGAGASGKPTDRDAYRLAQLEADFTAVIDTMSPGQPVHVLAHDWGSIQAWHFATSIELRGRIASLTSISGPELDHARQWLRSRFSSPRRIGEGLKQLRSSYYIGLFQLPVLPELVVTSKFGRRALRRSAAIGRTSLDAGQRREPAEADLVNGLQLYRANMLGGSGETHRRTTDIPVQVIAPTSDPFASTALQHGAPQPFASQLHTRKVAGGHWIITDRPDVIARLTAELVDHVEGAPASRGLARKRGGHFDNQLAVITGAGSGMGRATALELARQGAEIIATDVEETTAKETARLVGEIGGTAYSYQLDVSDRDQWERFASQLKSEHGVPDLVVNNAGIGMSGGFLDTTPEDWRRILDVNFWGVLHGSRLFGQQLVERGTGGRIVNIASAAAYSPSRVMVAYATTKAAVLMLSECLSADFARDAIIVTAICPGFVDTAISQTTTYVGVDAETERIKREHAVRSYGRRNYSPERAARHIVEAMKTDKSVVTITPEAKLFLALDRFAPSLQRRLARADLTKL
jgi:NAD(P)-dependent dehydrogenase (short-subunit alcohol dehydrogenase family)/pimeloyl-ACP methyl ester carboxylesterase